jgi:ammonia channel protein AmtB
VVGLIFPLRATAEAESEGLDTTAHGEEAYVHAGGSSQMG